MASPASQYPTKVDARADASAVASAVANGDAGASASAGASAGAGSDTQISPGSQTQVMTTPLTTVFTPPPACRTPFAYIDDCQNEFECNGSYLPFLYNRISSSPGITSIQCLPQTTVFEDGYVDGVYDYDPGLFCPDGMTTETSIANTFLCCPSGLTYSFNGNFEECTGTMTMGVAFGGPGGQNEGTIATTISWSAAENMTLYVAAVPVYLAQDSNIATSHTLGNLPATPTPSITEVSNMSETSTLDETSSAVDTTTSECFRGRECPKTPSTNVPSADASGPSIGVKVGAIVGGALAFFLLALGCILLLRYRRKRLRARHQPLDSPPTQPETGMIQQQQQGYQKKVLPELPVDESLVEMEGTQVDDHGPGIYVWKPELEGTAGTSGAVNVYVKKKSELEARHEGVLAGGYVLRTGSRTPMAPESPIVGPSFTRYSVPR